MSTLNKNNAPIGFFDSGVGGLTVLDKVKKIMPNESFVFYGDTIHVPYGEKTKSELIEFSEPILNFFKKKGCKAVVMACNTTSSLIYEDIKVLYDFKLYPVVQSVSKVLAQLPVKKIGVFGTKATIESFAYQNEISKYDSYKQVFGHYCKDWVHIVESNLSESPASKAIIKRDLDILLKCEPEIIVLGCTHYPYLVDVLSQFAPRDLFFDPSFAFADYIKNDLFDSGLLTSTDMRFEEFYVSSNPDNFLNASAMFYKLDKPPVLLKF